MRIRSAGLALLVAAGWLALAPSQAAGQEQQEQKEKKKQRDVIARWEIEASPKRSGTIIELIKSLRPHFLEAPRGVRQTGVGDGSNRAGAIVYVDGSKAGDLDVLRTMAADGVEEVRYLNPSKAQADYSLALGAGGIIEVKTTRKHASEKPAPSE